MEFEEKLTRRSHCAKREREISLISHCLLLACLEHRCRLCCVNDLVPSLKTLSMLSVLDVGLDRSCLPQDVR